MSLKEIIILCLMVSSIIAVGIYYGLRAKKCADERGVYYSRSDICVLAEIKL